MGFRLSCRMKISCKSARELFIIWLHIERDECLRNLFARVVFEAASSAVQTTVPTKLRILLRGEILERARGQSNLSNLSFFLAGFAFCQYLSNVWQRLAHFRLYWHRFCKYISIIITCHQSQPAVLSDLQTTVQKAAHPLRRAQRSLNENAGRPLEKKNIPNTIMHNF